MKLLAINMNGTEFRKRFVESLPPIPEEIGLNFDEFVSFDSQILKASGLNDKVIEFLLEAGLPRDAAPFLSFQSYTANDIEKRKEVFGIEDRFFPIGINGSGDPLVIDSKSGEVLFFNHDDNMRKVFINSSVWQFVECLCIYQEHMTNNTMNSCLEEIVRTDPRAAEKEAMWFSEIQVELDNG